MRILYIDIDTLRPDHLGCYGYHRNTSPNIDSIAQEGVRFENVYCSDAPCLPSRAALFTGRFGIHSGVVGHGGTSADLRLEGANRGFADKLKFQSMPAFFRRCGMRTASISPFAERHSAWWFYAGFNEMYNTGKSGHESAEEISAIALKWIEDNAQEENWFLHVNFWDPHTPYRAPVEFGNPFENDPLPEWLTEERLAEHRAMVSPHGARALWMYDNQGPGEFPRYPGELKDMDDLRRFVDGYDCGIRYADLHVGRLFAALRQEGVFDDVVVIISSDHGENIGELGLYGEHATADGITTHIPLIIRWPGGQKGHVDDGLHYNLDLLPTLADLLEQDPAPTWDGRSYAPVMWDGAKISRPFLVLSQCAHVCQRAVRFDDWIYIRTYHDGFHLFPDEMLFNLKDDPHQTNNLAETQRALCYQAVHHYLQWHDAMMATSPDTSDPLWIVMKEGGPSHARGQLANYAKFLEATDRGHFVPELRKRHPREFQPKRGW
ncbi:MAG: sulfatase [Limnochordia bacterium]|nr:sulfatase [Limnochordia bacterium]MDD4518427.1 sulfatase [Limnochordia bacterium]